MRRGATTTNTRLRGSEFHNLKTLFGAAIVSGEPVIANDPPNDPRRGGLPLGHPAMTAFLGLPIRVAVAGGHGRCRQRERWLGDFALVSWLQPLLLTIGQMVRHGARPRPAGRGRRAAS